MRTELGDTEMYLLFIWTNYVMNIPVEVQASQFYIHRNYVPVYYLIYRRLEDWLSGHIFRNDPSRVLLASPEYAFRRRFELTDTNEDYNNIEASALQFPFANYWPLNSGWQPDDRPAGNQAKLIYDGIYEDTVKLRATGVRINIPINFYFDREDDARLAFDTLWFLTYNEHYDSIETAYCGETLQLPFVIKLNNLSFNPSFKERDWLQRNRIFIISVDMQVRSYILFPPKQPDYKTIIKPEDESYDSGYENYYLTEEVIFNLFNYSDLLMFSMNVKGTIEDNGININLLKFDNIESNSAILKWDIENKEDLSRIEIKIHNTGDIIEIDPLSNSYNINDLTPNSTYVVYITFYNKSGVTKTLIRTFTTSQGIIEETKETPLDSLVGISW